jgi:endonuclease YncB( thermonuclease family)
MPTRRATESDNKPSAKPLAQILRRRRHRQWGILCLSLLGIAALCLADHAGFFVYPGDMLSRYDGQWFEVDRVIDGDTLDIKPHDGSTPIRLRLWGIDTPEIANKFKGTSDQPGARQAQTWTQQHCEGQQVRLKLQPQRIYGTYGRLLCYVYFEDGSMLNEQLLLEGLARTDARFVHQYMHRFDILQEQAHFDRKGLWAKQSRDSAVD